MFNKRPFV
jgi:hypothetical protein